MGHRPKILHELVLCHTNAKILDRDGRGCVWDDLDEQIWMGLDLLLLGDTLVTDLVEGVEESKIRARRKISWLEERVSMIKLINCWMSALKGESLRHHGSRKAVAMMRCADNKPRTKKKNGANDEILGKEQKYEWSHCLSSST